MGQSVRDIFNYIVDYTITSENATKEDKEKKRALKETDYKSFLNFMNIVNEAITGSRKNIFLTKLDKDKYKEICKEFGELCKYYSYGKFAEWIKNNKDIFSLYNINEKSKKDKIDQINFYQEVKKLLLEMNMENSELSDDIKNQARKNFKNSCTIYGLMKKELPKAFQGDYGNDEEDEYSNKSSKELLNILKKLEENGTEQREDRTFIDVVYEKKEIILELLERDDIAEQERKKLFEKKKDIEEEGRKRAVHSMLQRRQDEKNRI